MSDDKRIAELIKITVPMLRSRWPRELEKYSNRVIAVLFNDYYFSTDAGNNDAKFPEWFAFLDDYQKEVNEKPS
jgi:hypothetical protein